MSDLLHSRYHMRRELGQGGMSVVYLAMDERLKREVAVKVLHPHLATREDSRRRFLQEATAIARLEHPHILKIYDYASPEEERSYIVSQRIKGATLKQWIDELPPLPCEVVSLLALPIFEALAHAHEHSIIHRDVKPENIMIQEEDGAPILMDFGIAHLVDAETLTATGAVIGSPAHMAPEVVNGEPLTMSADLFSMGTVLYWMCCGSLPFVAPNPAALFRRILEARFDPLLERRPDTFAPLARLIERCMMRAPSDRPKDASEVAKALYLQLEEVGLADYQHELRALSEDPTLYIEELPQRLAPRYLARARALSEEGDGASALDRLNRALALAPELEGATQLREELLSARHAPSASRWALSLCAGVGLGVLAWQMLPSAELSAVEAGEPKVGRAMTTAVLSSSSLDTPKPERDVKTGEPSAGQGAPIDTSVTDEPPRGGELSVDKAPRAEGKRDASRGAVLKNLTPQPRVTARPKRLSSAKIKALRRGQIRARGVVKQRPVSVTKSVKSTDDSQDKAPKTGYQTVSVRSRYKGVSVWLNGAKVGRIFEVERSEGLKLALGRAHLVSFRSPYCEEQREQLRFEASQPTPTKLVFDCKFKPSSFRVKGPNGAEIYLRGEVPLRLGLTNQDISYKMTQASEKLSLLIVSKGRADQPLSMKLTAGKHTEVKLP